MNPADKFELHIPSAHGSEKLAMDFAADVARRMNFPKDRVEDLKTAVAEACMNAIEHGNKLDASTRVGIRLTVGKDRLQVSVQDKGAGVGTVPRPDLESRMQGRVDPRGWGIYLIENLMDEVTFESTADGGVVKMLIYLDKPE
jgi:serine/threonine-protein kinase RsbW